MQQPNRANSNERADYVRDAVKRLFKVIDAIANEDYADARGEVDDLYIDLLNIPPLN